MDEMSLRMGRRIAVGNRMGYVRGGNVILDGGDRPSPLGIKTPPTKFGSRESVAKTNYGQLDNGAITVRIAALANWR